MHNLNDAYYAFGDWRKSVCSRALSPKANAWDMRGPSGTVEANEYSAEARIVASIHNFFTDQELRRYCDPNAPMAL